MNPEDPTRTRRLDPRIWSRTSRYGFRGPPRLRSSSVSTIQNLLQHRDMTVSDLHPLTALVARPARNDGGGSSRNAFTQRWRED